MKFYLIFLTFIFSIIASATLSDVDKQVVWGKNLLLNGGFENGKGAGVNKWTASAGSFAIVTSGSNLLDGKVSFTWDAAAAADTLSYGQITVPNGLKGKNGVLAMKLMTPSGTATHSLQVYDGTNILGTVTITSSTAPTYNFVNFIWPSSGYVVARLYANANEVSITGDSAFLGDAAEINTAQISQAQFIGSAYFATTASCNWIRSNTAIGAFGTAASCVGPTVELNPGPGVIQTTDADLPRITVNNLPPGNYEVMFSGNGGNTTSTATNELVITDGTITTGSATTNSQASNNSGFTLVGYFNYTTAGNRTFEIYGSSSGGGQNIYNAAANNKTYFTIVRYPLSTEMAYNAGTSANSWSGYHDSTCSFARTNVAYGDPTTDASCALTERLNTNFGTVTGANNLPSITFTPSKVQKYFVCANVSVLGATSGADVGLKLWDGTTTIVERDLDIAAATTQSTVALCGIYSATSVAAKTLSIQTKASTGAVTIQALTGASAVEWSIFAIDQSLPAPLLVNSVVSSYAGVVNDEMAKLNCDAGSAITSQLGSWVSSIGNVSGGACAVTLLAGAFSATPYCVASVDAAFAATGLIVAANATSSTAVSIDCEDDASTACSAYDIVLHCRGAK